jgi:hypothetical protein
MNAILDDLHLDMFEEPSLEDARLHSDFDAPLTEEQWNTPLHPTGFWAVKIEFDDRAIKDDSTETADYSSLHRTEIFAPGTTLADFVRRIFSKPCYGVFEGLTYVGTDMGMKVYCFNWGT